MTTTDTTGNGVNGRMNTEADGLDDAASAFLASFEVEETDDDASKKKPSTEKTGKNTEAEHSETEETEETSDESPEGDTDDEETEKTGDEDDTGKAPEKKYVDNDDVFFKVKVGEEELEVSAKDLKRLYGQEAALTRRSQEVADQRKAVETEQQRYVTAIDTLVKQATAKAEEYRNINWIALAKVPGVTDEQIAQLQDDAKKAFDNEKFLKSELDGVVQEASKKVQADVVARAQATVKTLGDQASPLYIDGWNQQTYKDIVGFIKNTMGVPAELADNLVDAPLIKIAHMAMMFSKGASKVVVTKKTDKTPKKIVKTSNAPASRPAPKPEAVKKAAEKLSRTGSVDDAAELFLARSRKSDDE